MCPPVRSPVSPASVSTFARRISPTALSYSCGTATVPVPRCGRANPAALWPVRSPGGAWTTRRATPPTAPNWPSGTATVAPTSSGTCPDRNLDPGAGRSPSVRPAPAPKPGAHRHAYTPLFRSSPESLGLPVLGRRPALDAQRRQLQRHRGAEVPVELDGPPQQAFTDRAGPMVPAYGSMDPDRVGGAMGRSRWRSARAA